MSLQNKVAVITGASRGIGAGMAQAFADASLKLGLCARTKPALPNNSHAIAAAVDVTDTVALATFVEQVESELGAIDLWINNAGILDPIAPLREIVPEDFRKLIDINVMGVVYGSQAYVQHRRRHGGGGVLINISSGAATSAYSGWSAYCTSKAAVNQFSEVLSLEEADQGLRVYAVAPGIVDTYMQQRIRSASVEQFPMVGKFHQFKANNAFNSPGFVARQLLNFAFSAKPPTNVVVSVGTEQSN